MAGHGVSISVEGVHDEGLLIPPPSPSGVDYSRSPATLRRPASNANSPMVPRRSHNGASSLRTYSAPIPGDGDYSPKQKRNSSGLVTSGACTEQGVPLRMLILAVTLFLMGLVSTFLAVIHFTLHKQRGIDAIAWWSLGCAILLCATQPK